MQGLIDAHVHLLGGGQTLSWVDLSHVNSRQNLAAAVKVAAGQHCKANKTSLSALRVPQQCAVALQDYHLPALQLLVTCATLLCLSLMLVLH